MEPEVKFQILVKKAFQIREFSSEVDDMPFLL